LSEALRGRSAGRSDGPTDGLVSHCAFDFAHAQARRRLSTNRVVDGIALSPRELECLEWAAKGKSAWEIGRLLNITRRTAAFHLDNAKAKLGVRTICQAVAKLAASQSASE
jgi:LuxR family transcriptional regulator, activator of conjugal transfer of Ti plasmids